MFIAIRKEPNGTIYIDKEICSKKIKIYDEVSGELIETLAHRPAELKKPPYNYNVIELADKYSEAISSDFDDDFNFNEKKYTARILADQNGPKITELINKLKETDYQALKFAEGQLTIDEFKPIKDQRQLWRDEINELQAQIGKK